MEDRAIPARTGSNRQVLPESRNAGQLATHADLERARFIAELVARSVESADDTANIADQSIIFGMNATSNGDVVSGVHLFTRGLIAAALAAWQLNELATDASARRDFEAAQAQRSAAELQLSMLPGRVRLAATALRATPEGAAAIPQLRTTLLAFVMGCGVVRSLLAVTAQQPWLRTLAAAFESEQSTAGVGPVRAYGVPRLSLVAGGAEPRRGGKSVEGRPALSVREREVLAQIVSGKTTAEIAEHLGVKSTTISTLVGRIFNKLGVNNRPAAVAVALRFGLCSPLDEALA